MVDLDQNEVGRQKPTHMFVPDLSHFFTKTYGTRQNSQQWSEGRKVLPGLALGGFQL